MSEPLDFNTLKILYDHGIPRKITLDVDKEELRKDLIDSGLDKRFVQNLIKVLGAGMTLDMDWEFLEDYDREEVQSRITRRTMLKPEVVSDVLDQIYDAYSIIDAESCEDLLFRIVEDGLAVSGYNEDAVSIEIPALVYYEDELYKTTYIEYRGFSDLKALESITIPDSITEIDPAAFRDCTSLKTINFPNSVDKVDFFTFSGCSSLESITIPGSVKYVYMGGSDYAALRAIDVAQDNDHYESLEGVLYKKGRGELLLFPPGKQVDVFTVPDSVSVIGGMGFINCKSLKSVILPNSVKIIEASSFNGCSALETIAIPDSVESIELMTFRKCTSLNSIVIPNSVLTIDSGAFFGCSSLETIILPDHINTIGNGIFSGCSALKSIKISPENKHFTSINGVLYKKEGHEIIRYPPGKDVREMVIPDSITRIWEWAFNDCTSIKSLIISDSIHEIEKYVFSGCSSLTTVTIPDSISTIKDGAFEDCTSLRTINIPKTVKNIDDQAFKGCRSLSSISRKGILSVNHNCVF